MTKLYIGWASADITPDEPVILTGQFYARISERVADPVTVTAMAIESVDEDGTSKEVILVSCDQVTIPHGLLEKVRDYAARSCKEINSTRIILNATHTHSAPEVRTTEDADRSGGGNMPPEFGVKLEAMKVDDCVEFIARKIVAAIEEAWRKREISSIGYGLGEAVVGRNRQMVYSNGLSKMYGNPNDPAFSHIEAAEDHSVNVLGTWNEKGALTGIVVNVPCPAQVSESSFEMTADYWKETRDEIHRRFGKEVYVLPQISAAGDQAPHVLLNKNAYARMLRLAGRSLREDIAIKLTDAVSFALTQAEKEKEISPVFSHESRILALPRRKITKMDVQKAQDDAEKSRIRYEALRAELTANPELKMKPRWYKDLSGEYRRMNWHSAIEARYETQEIPLEVEIHVIRLGDIAIATNPFELYVDYGFQIKARSNAVQTFIVQLAGSGSYVPTERAVAGKSYGAVAASTPTGPEGGRILVEETVSMINSLWKEKHTAKLIPRH